MFPSPSVTSAYILIVFVPWVVFGFVRYAQSFLLVEYLIDWPFFVFNIVIKSSHFLGLLLFLLFHVFFREFYQEKLFLCLHFSSDEAAIKGSIPFLLVLFGVKPHVNVEPLLILLNGKDNEDVRLCVVVNILNLMQLYGLWSSSCCLRVVDAQLVCLQDN